MIGTILKQLTKNVAALPGWVPLVVVIYAYVYADPVLSEFSREYQVVIVTVSAYVFYQLGDAFDKAIFKSVEPAFVAQARDEARRALMIHEGIYNICKSLADSAGLYTFSGAQICNETAKLLRSVAVALIIVVITFAAEAAYWEAVLALFAATTCGVAYVHLKALHMKLLYNKAPFYPLCSRRYFAYPIDNHIVLFFWDGTLIGSGRMEGDA